MSKKKDSITIEGIISGDYESFCFDVTKKDYVRITGEKPDKFRKSYFHKGKFRLYPDHIFRAIGLSLSSKVKLTITYDLK